MRENRSALLSVFLFTAMIMALRSPIAASREIFEFKFSGGIGQYGGQDLTRHLAGWNTNCQDLGLILESRLKFTRLGSDLEGQFILNLSRSFGIGAGAGLFRVDEDSQLAWTQAGQKLVIRDRFKADITPLTLFVVLHLPLGAKVRFNASGGVGYHRCKISWMENRTVVEDGWSAEKNNAIGYQAALSMDFQLLPHIALVLEAFGRSLKLEGLTGPRRFQGQEYAANRLWLGQEGSAGKKYDKLAIKETIPGTDASHSGRREAVIDLTTIGLRAGINFRF